MFKIIKSKRSEKHAKKIKGCLKLARLEKQLPLQEMKNEATKYKNK